MTDVPGGVESLEDGLQSVLDQYKDARSNEEFGTEHPLWRLFSGIQNVLEELEPVARRPGIKVKWSVGQGNWAYLPWIALFDERETKTIQDGVYCVYLFREDMSGLYLTINQGVTRPVDEYGRKKARRLLLERADRVRDYCANLPEQGFEVNNDVDLRTDRKLGEEYERSTVAHKLYVAGDIPSEELLVADIERVLKAYDRYIRRGNRGVSIDSERSERYRKRFLARLPEFEDFQSVPGSFDDRERKYKLELADRFRNGVLPLLENFQSSQEGAHEIVNSLDSVLRKPLQSTGKPQNLLPWRYFDFLRKLSEPQEEEFALTFERLILGDESSPERVEQFNSRFRGLLGSVDDFRYYDAISRSFPTLFLMLTSPEDDVYIRTELFEKAFGDLAEDGNPFDDRPLDADQYRKTLQFCAGVYEQLDRWGWSPRDLVDVQSFLWVATRDNSPEEADGEVEEKADTQYEPTKNIGAVSDEFSSELRKVDLSFGNDHDAFVRDFVVSLATKQLVLLTGLSGSGKTQIALQFGRWLSGADEKRYRVVPVRPDWTGPEALFGYEDALQDTKDGRKAWHVPGPLRFMLRAARDEERPYLMVLDEMNLAHVERYFADVISGMESGERCLPNLRKEEDGMWRKVPGEGEPDLLPFPDNLFITGTVNVDETTYMFSPKVLDRANTLDFRVETEDLQADIRKPGECEPGDPSLVRGFLEIARDEDWHLEHPPEEKEGFVERLKDLHRELDSGFSFGHRVLYEAVRYAALHQEAGGDSMEDALDIQVLQKVLPRIHGSRRRVESVLRTVGKFCWDLNSDGDGEPGPEGFDPTEPPPTAEGQKRPALPRSFDKVQRMTERLRANQFVSFTE